MRDIRDAFEALKDIIGDPALEFDGLGRAELVVEDQISVYLYRISDYDFELSAYITARDRYVSNDQLLALLRLNSLKDGVRHARFALDASGVPFLCQRVNVRPLDKESLDSLVLGFIQCVLKYRDADLTQTVDVGGPLRAGDLSLEGDIGNFIRA